MAGSAWGQGKWSADPFPPVLKADGYGRQGETGGGASAANRREKVDRAEKQEQVTALQGVFKASQAVVVAHYSGLTVAQMSALRRQMKQKGAGVKVAKNRLAKKALEGTEVAHMAPLFRGPTVIAYSGDPVTARPMSHVGSPTYSGPDRPPMVNGSSARPALSRNSRISETAADMPPSGGPSGNQPSPRSADRRIAARKSRLESEVQDHAARVEHRIEQVRFTPLRTAALLVSFFAIGVYGGFVQAGVGFLIITGLLAHGLDLVRINAVKVFVTLIFTVAALAVFVAHGQVDWPLGLALAAGNAAGGWAGTHVAIKKGHDWIKKVVSLVVLLFALKLLFG